MQCCNLFLLFYFLYFWVFLNILYLFTQPYGVCSARQLDRQTLNLLQLYFFIFGTFGTFQYLLALCLALLVLFVTPFIYAQPWCTFSSAPPPLAVSGGQLDSQIFSRSPGLNPATAQQALSCPKTPKTRIFHKSPNASHERQSHASTITQLVISKHVDANSYAAFSSLNLTLNICASPSWKSTAWSSPSTSSPCSASPSSSPIAGAEPRCYRGLLFTTPSY